MTEQGEPLTEREFDVLTCIVQGASNKEIARQLSISPNTVKVHVRNIYSKLGVSSRTEATTAALQQGLLTIPGMESVTDEEVEPASDITISDVPVDTYSEAVIASAPDVPASVRPAVPEDTQSRRVRGRSPRLAPGLVGVIALVVIILAVAVGILLSGNGLFGESSPEESGAESAGVPFVDTPIPDSNWSVGRPMSAARANAASAVVGLNLYLIGGETADGVVNLVEIYALDESQWLEGAPKLTPVADGAAVVLSGEVYVIGGRLQAGQGAATVEAYSPLNDGWRTVTPLPQPTYGGVALTDGSHIYYFGGYAGESVTGESYRYDPSSQSWEALPPMKQPRAHSGGGMIGGQFFVAGGTDGASTLASCEQFDPATESWSSCPDMQQPRAGAGGAVLLNMLYLFGGQSEEGVRNGEAYDPSTTTWKNVETPLLDESLDWRDMGVANVETRIYVIGGRRGDRYLADTYVFTPFTYQFFIPAASSGAERDQ